MMRSPARLAIVALATALGGLLTNSLQAAKQPTVQVIDRTVANRLSADKQANIAWRDPYFAAQWNLHGDSGGGGNFPIFSTLADSPRTVVAVVDSGFLLNHEDIRFLPGYDFVSSAEVGNDGDGRDADPTDPGDWVEQSSPDCIARPSSWHGTRVAGIIGANTANGIGIAAANHHVDLLPVRVTGTCGGYVSDLIDGIRWAAGLDVAKAPPNPYPASVINISLGFPGECPQALQLAINAATAVGAVIVTASTNSAADLDVTPHAPAVCEHVLTAAAATRDGRLANYSAYGSAVDVLAPGGDRALGIITTDNRGDTHAEPDSIYASHYGTSLAGAHLAALAAAMRWQSPHLDAAQIGYVIRASATPVGPANGCELLACGGGIMNASAALQLARVSTADDLSVAPQLPVLGAAAGAAGGGGAGILLLLTPLVWLRRRAG